MVCGSWPICISKGRNYRIIYCDCEDDSELFTAVHVRRAGNSGCDDHLVYFGYAYRHAGDLSIITKYKDTYTLIIAPVTALLISGYFYNTVGYNGFTKFEGVITHGILRAFVGLNIGCLVYMFAEYLKKKEFRSSVKRLLGIAELLLYLLAIFMMHEGGKTCVFYNNILLLFAISITASKQSAISGVFDNKVSKFLGEMSLFIYLCQSPARATVRYIFPDVSYWTGFAYIVGLTFVSVAFGMILIHWIARMNRQKTQLK